MTNLEKYMDEILKNVGKMQLKCVLLELRNGVCYRFDDRYEGKSCTECSIDSIKWLAEEYKPKIKLNKFEYDLIMCCFDAKKDDDYDPLNTWWILINMKKNGYFKDVDLKMTFEEVLERVEVENEQ